MIQQLINLFNHPIFIIFGGISACVGLITVILSFIFWVFGVSPLLWRLGLGRWLRKIAIAADSDKFSSIKDDLVSSGVFRERNISHITKDSLAKIKEHSLIVVHYNSFTEDNIRQMLNDKRDGSGMIVYFPEYDPANNKQVPVAINKVISSKANTTLVNFRGRLLNDIVTTLITTSYEKR